MESDKHIHQLLNLDRQLTAIEEAEMQEQLIQYINHLLVYDFNKLVQILYRVDVSEQKLKELLKANAQTDASTIIAALLIQRQVEKIKTKEAFKPNDNITGEDKW
jgi:hypothetical protein